ncbi:MAG TPA: hypothetical protein VF163_08505 [Micromonosporaceae bacterium]
MMASPLDVQLILCDAAQADPSGKVHMLGAGWSVTRSPTGHAVAVLIKVPWDRANERLPLRLDLVDADGQPVQLPTADGSVGVRADGLIEVGRPPGMEPGSPLDAAFALNVPSLPLAPGRYSWRLSLAEFEASVSFAVRP